MAIETFNLNDNGATIKDNLNANFTDLDTTKADLASPTFTGTPTLPTGTIATTQSPGDNTTKVATTAFVIANSVSGATGFSTTQVFTGTAPTSYTDLDLSAVVGATQRMVMLRVFDGGGSGYYSFRPNGTTYTQDDASSTAQGVSRTGVIGGTPSGSFVIVKTDTAGVIEWKGNTGDIKIEVMAYW